MATVISIDWDFFLWRGGEAKTREITVFPGTPNELVTDVFNLYDWGHSEGHHPTLQTFLWENRYAGFFRVGLDPKVVTGNWLAMGCTRPSDFISEVEQRFDFDDAFLWLADSHAMGLPTVIEAYTLNHEPVHVVHFDAHADLGYHADEVRMELEQGTADCASWLWHALKMNKAADATIVYPDWRDDEWSDVSQSEHINEVASRVRAMHWSEWLNAPYTADDNVVCSIIARSSAWTPPWFDKRFEKFWSAFPHTEMTCLDCTETCGRTPGGYDACTPRKFNAAAAKAQAEMVAKYFESKDKT